MLHTEHCLPCGLLLLCLILQVLVALTEQFTPLFEKPITQLLSVSMIRHISDFNMSWGLVTAMSRDTGTLLRLSYFKVVEEGTGVTLCSQCRVRRRGQ